MSKAIWVIIGVVILLGGIIVYNKVLHPKDKPAGKQAGGGPKELSAAGFIVKPQDQKNNIIASGSLLAYEDAELHPEVSGRIISLNIQEGSPVSKGTLMVKLYDADLQAQLKKQQSQKETAEKTEQRLKQLLAINGIGQQEYDNATTALKGILADMEYTQAQIGKTEIRAPFNGVVGLKNVSLGAYVSPTTVIASIQQIDLLKIDFSIPEKYAAGIKKNDPINFTVDGYAEKFTGKIFAIDPHIEEATRTIKVRAVVQNSKARLLPGAYAKVDLGLSDIKDALMVPTQCIIPEARGKKIVLVKNGKAEFSPVETGIRNETYIQVTSGVEAGDTVVATGIMYVKPGVAIKVNKIIE